MPRVPRSITVYGGAISVYYALLERVKHGDFNHIRFTSAYVSKMAATALQNSARMQMWIDLMTRASSDGEKQNEDVIVGNIVIEGCRSVVLTGGAISCVPAIDVGSSRARYGLLRLEDKIPTNESKVSILRQLVR